jgi:aspartate aminotransferase
VNQEGAAFRSVGNKEEAMGLLSTQVEGYLQRASWIRKMFETGAALKKQHGEDAVCDFSLGNPDLPPPLEVKQAMLEIAEGADKPFAFGYMPNPGYPWARQALAEHLSAEQGVPVTAEDVIVTCGAAGAINAFFRAVLNPGDVVLGVAPFFVEYGFYVENHGGGFKPVPSAADFSLDLEALDKALTPDVRAVLINSPNNPTGQVYGDDEIVALARLLEEKSKKFGRPVFLVSDEPYRFLTFDGVQVPSVLPHYPYSVVVSSFSKSLSLAGERVGYALLAPDMPDKATLAEGMVLANRILGFVNAPSVGQALMAKCLSAQVDVSVYDARRKAMAKVLDDAGYEYLMPKGAFYFFPKAPGGDDVAFVNRLQEQLVLAVPGTGFGRPGHFRLTFCVGREIIERSASGFARARE